MASRYRYRFAEEASGGLSKALIPGGSDVHWPPIVNRQDCLDWVGNRQGVNPFDMYNQHHYAGVYSGVFGYYEHQSVPIDLGGLLNFGSVPGVPTDDDAVTHALAVTNPSRAYIDPGMIWQDIADIPKMIYHAGESIIDAQFGRSSAKKIASNYIEYKFGWQPLIGDFFQMLRFAEKVQDRLRELEHLKKKGGLKREFTVFDQKVARAPVSTYLIPVYGSAPSADVYIVDKCKKWVTIQYKLNNPTSLDLSADDTLKLARNLVSGSNFSYSTIWELMPWTWLFDYFGNVGDILKTTRNMLDTSPDNICVMTHTQTLIEAVHPHPGAEGFAFHPGCCFESKIRRWGFGPFPVLRLPFLNPESLSILAGLGIQRIAK